jgi:ubiquinone/menaquinone biosynthesis C-methylase UbiE
MSSKQYFDEVAQQWDDMRETFFSEAVREKAISIAGVQPGSLAADIGAGSGFITEGLIQKGLEVIAVDQSEAMLAEMKQKFAAFDGIDYRVGEAETLPIDDETVDYIFANMYLHHVESPPQAIKEMVRALKPGGKLVITDLDEHNFEFLRTEQHDRWMGFKRDDVQRWSIEAGLDRVGTDCVGEDCCAQSSCGDEYASVSIFVAFGEKGYIHAL